MIEATPVQTSRAAHRAAVKTRKRRERFARDVIRGRKRAAADLLQAVNLRENPNSAKRRAARLADPLSGRVCAEVGLQYVSRVTPARDTLGRLNPRMTPRETITTRRGRTVSPAAPILPR